jgi:hypothetical protein
MIVVAILLVLVPRRNFAEYGLNFTNWKQDISAALTAYLPASLAVLPTAFVDSNTWGGALIISLAIILAILVIAWLLRRGTIPLMGIITILLTILGFGISAVLNGTFPPLKTAFGNFMIYAVFVGFGEEILWRGYIQSRLNHAFGKPYQFLGISWGMGLILASVFFGFAHVLNGWPEQWYWAWGIWTACNGLLLGLVREKTGSVLASSFLHGLPFGLGRAFGL